jgi:hypothetical protein
MHNGAENGSGARTALGAHLTHTHTRLDVSYINRYMGRCVRGRADG